MGLSARRFSAVAAALAATTLLASCIIPVGPDFLHPAPPEISQYTHEPLRQTSSTDAPNGAAQLFLRGRDIPQEWWRLFRSPGLNRLIERSLQSNPNLQAAMFTLGATQESVYAQEGHFFPFIQGNFIPTRQRSSEALSPVTSSPTAFVFNLYTAQVLVSYTVDVWGLNWRTVETLQAEADMQRFQVEAAYLTLTSNVAVAAITEASLRAQIDATNELISLNTKMLDILRHQLEAGFANRTDVAAQEAALAQVQATLPPLRKALAQTRDLLAALSGGYPSEGPRETFKLESLHLPVDLPVSLPSQLIEQRPDVRATQEMLHAASAQVGVATANLLPSFTINANGGYISTILGQLFNPANQFWLIGGNITQPIFEGGTLLHQLRGAKATYDQAAWAYRAAVIGAVQNVADTLHALQNDADALKAARDFERAAKISFDLARQQMQTGNANILLLLLAQQTYLQAEIQVVLAQAARLSDTAALFQALGGGWWNRPEAPTTPKILNVGTGWTTTLIDRHY